MALAAVAASCGSPTPPEIAVDRVLVFSRTEEFRHPSIEAGIAALSQLASQEGWELDATEDAAAFSPEHLEDYTAVVFLSTTGDVLNETQQSAFVDFVRTGGGFVGIHSAADTEHDWPWYGSLVGAYFEQHPRNPNVRAGTLLVQDPTQLATAPLPTPWNRTDEWYEFSDMQTGLSILLTIDESSYKTPAENPALAPRPIAWQRDFDGGRSFYTALGHTPESFAEPLFLAHLRGGLAWVLGG